MSKPYSPISTIKRFAKYGLQLTPEEFATEIKRFEEYLSTLKTEWHLKGMRDAQNERTTKIVQIATVGDDYTAPMSIYGLGEDSKLYYWNPEEAIWELFRRTVGYDRPF